MTRVETFERLGAWVVECGRCQTKVMECAAVYLRRCWLNEDGTESKGERILRYACSRECAERLEADVRDEGRSSGESVFWIDDAHLSDP
jgi:hypothetical protein